MQYKPVAKQDLPLIALALAAFFLRLAWIWPDPAAPVYFYSDSAAHVMFDWLLDRGAWDGPASGLYHFPLMSWLRAAAWRVYPDIFYAPIALNILLSAMTLVCLYLGTRAASGRKAGLLACVLLISLPSFCRLTLSGQPEVLYLFLVSAAFFMLCLEGRREGAASLGLSSAALLLFYLSSYVRAESIGFLGAYALLLGWRLRARPLGLACLALAAAAAFDFRHAEFLARVRNTYWSNASVARFTFWQHVLYVPRAVFGKFDPSPALILLPLHGYYAKTFDRGLRTACSLAYINLGLLWLASLGLLMSWETDRNLCVPLLPLCGGAAAVLTGLLSGASRRPLKLAAAAGAAACLLASWSSTVKPPPSALSTEEEIVKARAIGVQLRRLSALFREDGSGALLFQPDALSFPDVMVVSGLKDSLRFVGAVSGPAADSLKHRRGEKAWGMLVRSDALRRELDAEYGGSRKLLSIEGYDLYKFRKP